MVHIKKCPLVLVAKIKFVIIAVMGLAVSLVAVLDR